MLLTENDLTLLSLLSTKVRTASLTQVANRLYSGSLTYAKKRLVRLESEGLCHLYRLAAAEAELRTPLATWRPGDPLPDFAALAYRLQTRWKDLELCPVPCVIASARYARSLGGHGGRRSRPSEGTHDLALTGVYLAQPEDRKNAWEGERPGTARGEKKPDAVIGDTALEVGGSSYTAKKLEEFFTYCGTQGLSVELW